MAWWTPQWRTAAEDWTFVRLPDDGQSGGAQSPQAEAETDYLNVFLKSARVVDARIGFTTFYGAVHSFITLEHRSGGKAQFNVITAPSGLKNLDARGIDRVVQLNQRLLGPVPYAGGDLTMEIGLFSIASSNLAAPYLQLLESLSKTAGVSYISAALPFAGPILEGMRLLTQSDRDAMLEVGIATQQQPPALGHFAIVRAPKGRLEVARLRIDPSDFRLLLNGEPLRDYPYMVVEITAGPTRSDWFTIPEITAAYRRVQDEYRAGRPNGVADAIAAFRRTAISCNDLQDTDARKLADNVAAKFRDIGPPQESTRGGVSRATDVALPDLKDIGLFS
jgi:hypothetical protein